MRVPDEAGVGKAKVQVTLADWKEKNIEPVTAEVSVEQVPASPLLGRWSNVDKKTLGITRLQVTTDGESYTIQAWGSASGGEIEWKKVPLELLGDSIDDLTLEYGFATWNHGFAVVHFTLRLEREELVVETFDIFKDESGRSNYRTVHKFKRQE